MKKRTYLMPLYEFECKNCGAILEKLMKISDKNPEVCDHCQGGPLVKLMSRTNFVLKGQGWYETDFKHKGKPKPMPQTSESGEKASDKGSSQGSNDAGGAKETKPESKPADKAAAKKTN